MDLGKKKRSEAEVTLRHPRETAFSERPGCPGVRCPGKTELRDR